MKDSVVSDTVGASTNHVDAFSSVLSDLQEQASLLTPQPQHATIEPGAKPEQTSHVPSYQPYPWQLLNRVLDLVDRLTNGRAGLVQRVISYLFFGGVAALVNLGIFYLMYYHILAALNPVPLRNVLSYIVAAECSIIANFVPNDRFTFSMLPGAKRPWLQRCARFHLTTIVGSLLTFLIEFALSSFTPIQPILAEIIATLLVLIYNFSFHHLFTYRHLKHA
jgi:putative flippase GtrA